MSGRNGKCYHCSLPPFWHGRCFRHYVLRFVQRRGWEKQVWFYSNESVFISAMAGRRWAHENGVKPAVISTAIDIFYERRPHPKGGKRMRREISKMVEAIDRQLRKKYGDKKKASANPAPSSGGTV